ncbi:MAG: efflux RND transporter periplasmic adaptor subunit [Rhodospirillaceae bacterium]|nr:efflux RND transporter periplasmic adaptor subunit [Rhodospirillaceae bacterium]
MRLLAAVAWLVLSAATAHGQTDQGALVDVDAVRLEPMTQTQSVVGQFVAMQSSVVAARVDGPVLNVSVTVGDSVAAGDLLAELDTDRLQAALDLATATLDEQRARVESATATEALFAQDVARIERLRGSAAFNQARLDDAIAERSRAVGELAEAVAGVHRAEVARDLAALEVAYSEIRAPFPGVISTREVDVGEYVRIGDPIVTLVNHHDLEIEAAVPAASVGGLSIGRQVLVRVTASLSVSAEVRAVVPVEDPLTRTRIVRLTPDLDYETAGVAARQSAVVEVPVEAEVDVVTVDKDAVLSGPQGRLVFVVDDGVAQPRPVEIGASLGNRFEVLGGLEPGELVVVRGNEGLRPGQLVAIR